MLRFRIYLTSRGSFLWFQSVFTFNEAVNRNCRRSLEFFDLLPEDPKLYDKMRPPKKDGQATVVYFHVTVMGLDSIDENSMVLFVTTSISYIRFKFLILFQSKFQKGFKKEFDIK